MKKLVEILKEVYSTPSQQAAHKMGLKYIGFKRWVNPQTGKVVFNSAGSYLAPKQEEEQPNKQQKPEKPKPSLKIAPPKPATYDIEQPHQGYVDLAKIIANPDPDVDRYEFNPDPAAMKTTRIKQEPAKSVAFGDINNPPPDRRKDFIFHQAKQAAKKLEPLGYSVDKFLGSGGWGATWQLKDGRALKMTTDIDETKTSSKLMKFPHENIAKIERVFKFKSDQNSKDIDTRNMSYIIQERLYRLPRFMAGGVIPSGTTSNLVKAMYELHQSQQKSNIDVPFETMFKIALEQVNKASQGKLNNIFNNKNLSLNQRREIYKMLLDVAKGGLHLAKLGIRHIDAHLSNVMRDKNNNYKLIDIGESQGAEKEKPEELPEALPQPGYKPYVPWQPKGPGRPARPGQMRAKVLTAKGKITTTRHRDKIGQDGYGLIALDPTPSVKDERPEVPDRGPRRTRKPIKPVQYGKLTIQ